MVENILRKSQQRILSRSTAFVKRGVERWSDAVRLYTPQIMLSMALPSARLFSSLCSCMGRLYEEISATIRPNWPSDSQTSRSLPIKAMLLELASSTTRKNKRLTLLATWHILE